MNDLNSVYLVGRLTKDAIVKENDKTGNKTLCFTLISNRYSYNETTKEYDKNVVRVDIEAEDDQKAKIAEYLKKGLRIGVNGYLTSSKSKNTLVKAFTLQVLEKVEEKAS